MRTMIALLLFAAGSEYKAEVEQWRARQEASLKSDTGWLTVAGLEWLKPGKNELAPFGVFELRDGKVYLQRTSDGAPVEMLPDTSGRPTVVTEGSQSVQVIGRGVRLGLRVKDKQSKLRKEFTGRKWFPVNEAYRIQAKWVPYDPPKTIVIPNVLGDKSEVKTPGAAVFTLEGKEYRLEPDGSGKTLFFIFRDQTAGHETYGAGRFLDADAPKDGHVILDFNKAVNPPCAFTPYATCPLPPQQNKLAVRIPAGELRYGDH
jgi:uncharacterized protein